jgi:hypothetical protein
MNWIRKLLGREAPDVDADEPTDEASDEVAPESLSHEVPALDPASNGSAPRQQTGDEPLPDPHAVPAFRGWGNPQPAGEQAQSAGRITT